MAKAPFDSYPLAPPAPVEEASQLPFGVYSGDRAVADDDSSWEAYLHEFRGWNTEYPVDLNESIAGAIQAAADEGRNEVVVFDFGCGYDKDGHGLKAGNGLRDLAQGRVSGKMAELLHANPGIRLRLIGLTDLPADEAAQMKPQELAAGTDVHLPGVPANVSVHIDYYPVTAAHTLQKYFESKGIEFLDVAIAKQSLRYLPTPNLEATLQSIIDRLRPGNGILAAKAYHNSPPGFKEWLSTKHYNPHAEAYAFDDPHKGAHQRRPGTGATIAEAGRRFVPAIGGAQTDLRQEVDHLTTVVKRYEEMGVLDRETVDYLIREQMSPAKRMLSKLGLPLRPEQVIGSDEARSREALAILANGVVRRIAEGLTVRRAVAEKARRMAVLTGLQSTRQEVDMQFNGSAIVVRKK